MTIRTGVNYGDAETRGKLRAWKKRLAANYAIFDKAFQAMQSGGPNAVRLLGDMVKGTKLTRDRAFRTIEKSFGPGVTREREPLARGSAALWSILKPRDSVTVAPSPNTSASEKASLAQDCVTVEYVLLGTNDGLVCAGLWTLEVPDHALGRAVERSGLLQPGTIIREAHQNLLALPADIKNIDDRNGGNYIKAGAGCFPFYITVAEDISAGSAYSASVKVNTWLDEDQMFEDQVILSEKGKPGETLGDSWLMPHPLRRITKVEPNLCTVMTLNPWTMNRRKR